MAKPNKYDGLIYELCVGLGWCGWSENGERRHINDYIPSEGFVTADQFAVWVVEADFCDPVSPDAIRRWLPRIKEAFIKHMGAEKVHVSEMASGA